MQVKLIYCFVFYFLHNLDESNCICYTTIVNKMENKTMNTKQENEIVVSKEETTDTEE